MQVIKSERERTVIASRQRPLKVLHIVANLDERFGGPSHSVPALVAALRKVGCDGSIFTTEKSHQIKNHICDDEGLMVLRAPYLFSNAFHFKPNIKNLLRKIITSGEFDILHVHSTWRHAAWAATSLAADVGLPLVVSPRSNLMMASLATSRIKKQIMRKIFVNQMLDNASLLHSTSSQETEDLVFLNIPRNKIIEIPNGLPKPSQEFNRISGRAHLAAFNNTDLGPDDRVALYLARIHPRKNTLELIKSASEVLTKHTDWKLLVAGPCEDDAYLRECKSMAGPFLDTGRIIFSGMLRGKDKAAAFAASDLFILPTKFENFGLSIGEALAVGLPVITTTSTPWHQIATENAGWIIPPDDITALTSAWSAAAECDDMTLREMGARGQPLVQPFTWDGIAAQFAQQYRQISQPRSKC